MRVLGTGMNPSLGPAIAPSMALTLPKTRISQHPALLNGVLRRPRRSRMPAPARPHRPDRVDALLPQRLAERGALIALGNECRGIDGPRGRERGPEAFRLRIRPLLEALAPARVRFAGD